MSALRPGNLRPQNAIPPLANAPPSPSVVKPAAASAPKPAAAASPAPAPKPAAAAVATPAKPTTLKPAASTTAATAASPASPPPPAKSLASAATPKSSGGSSSGTATPATPKGASTSRSVAPIAGSGQKSVSVNLLESRAAAKKDLPLNVKMVLQKRPEMWADPMFAHNYPVEVWDHYDVNRDGVLNKSEISALAKDLVDRIVSMCKDGMRTQMPKSSDADIEKLIKKELPHILPAKTIEESRRMMAEHIYKELDVSKDGIVTRTSFFFNWQSVSQKVLDVNKVKQEALACVIL